MILTGLFMLGKFFLSKKAKVSWWWIIAFALMDLLIISNGGNWY